MTLRLYYVGSKNPSWLEDAARDYDKKIGMIVGFKRELIRSRDADRKNADLKKAAEAKEILKVIESSDHLILLDEHGKEFDGSVVMSAHLQKILARQNNKIVFLIGGPYGVTDEIKNRADETWRLSKLTFNHHLAQLLACEQIYRSLAIWKNLPYHNY